jgi:LysR substrate binding domain
MFTAQHPGLEAHLVLSDAGLEVEADACDLVLRSGLPSDPAMIARKITTSRILCASPSYLARRGTPNTPDDLKAHSCLRLARRHQLLDLWHLTHDGRDYEVRVGGPLSAAMERRCMTGRFVEKVYPWKHTGMSRMTSRRGGSWRCCRITVAQQWNFMPYLHQASPFPLALGAPLGSTIYAAGGFTAIAIVTVLVPLATILIVAHLASSPPKRGERSALLKVAAVVWMPGFGSALSSIGFGTMIAFSSLLSAERHGIQSGFYSASSRPPWSWLVRF